MTTKKIKQIYRGIRSHWVGDGFPVSTMISYSTQGAEISPFLLLDYAGPADFEPANQPRGVGLHPHRGFETVTIVYSGEVEHKDSAGNAGKIGPGDVQWMTAARGILHEEKHSRRFTEQGGKLEIIQLWVNLPAEHKMTKPRYQEITNAIIPVVELSNHAGKARIIAGHFDNTIGAAQTFTPINLWDIRLNKDSKVTLPLPDGYTTALLVLKGNIKVNDTELLTNKELALFEKTGEHIYLEATEPSVLLIMNGEPINEPIEGYGPFVMNTQAEIQQAMADFEGGLF
ncbi:MAG: pirin family protein [Methylococcales bacterium]